MISKFLLLLILFLNNCAYAVPAPIGLELNKATLSDVTKKYKIIKKERNYWDGYNYFIDSKDIDVENISNALVICDDQDIVQAIILTANKNKFQEFYDMLSDKYTLKNKTIPFVGNKNATFTDDECSIILDAPHLSFDMELIYITDNFYKKFTSKLDKEEELKQEKERGAL